MKSLHYHALVMLLVLALLVSGCGVDGLSSEEVYTKALEAISNIDSYTFTMEYDQSISIPGVMDMQSQVSATGQAIEEPPAMNMDMVVEAEGMVFYMSSYLVDDVMYLYMDEFGWVWMSVEEELGLAQTFQDPADFMKLLKEVGMEKIEFSRDGNYYILDLFDESGTFMDAMMEEVMAQGGLDMFGGAEVQELFRDMEFSDIRYKLAVDTETFLPAEVWLSYTATINFMNEEMIMEQDVHMTMDNYGTIDEIVVPQEVIDAAVHIEQLNGF